MLFYVVRETKRAFRTNIENIRKLMERTIPLKPGRYSDILPFKCALICFRQNENDHIVKAGEMRAIQAQSWKGSYTRGVKESREALA